MAGTDELTEHYGRDGLVTAIEAALTRLGLDRSALTEADLAPVGEFHIGGRAATGHLLDRAGFDPSAKVLDIGCGTGGTARLLSSSVASVTGVDLTDDYVEAGREMNRWLGLDDRIELRTGNALKLPSADEAFDGAVMLHVGMNIEDKPRLMAEVARVLVPGAVFALYDIMLVGPGEPDYPMPWADNASMSHLAGSEQYRDGAEQAGFHVHTVESRADFALAFFERLQTSGGPSPLGLQILMGPTAGQKIANLAEAVRAGILAPVEMILVKS